jgi:hypothetical protein
MALRFLGSLLFSRSPPGQEGAPIAVSFDVSGWPQLSLGAWALVLKSNDTRIDAGVSWLPAFVNVRTIGTFVLRTFVSSDSPNPSSSSSWSKVSTSRIGSILLVGAPLSNQPPPVLDNTLYQTMAVPGLMVGVPIGYSATNTMTAVVFTVPPLSILSGIALDSFTFSVTSTIVNGAWIVWSASLWVCDPVTFTPMYMIEGSKHINTLYRNVGTVTAIPEPVTFVLGGFDSVWRVLTPGTYAIAVDCYGTTLTPTSDCDHVWVPAVPALSSLKQDPSAILDGQIQLVGMSMQTSATTWTPPSLGKNGPMSTVILNGRSLSFSYDNCNLGSQRKVQTYPQWLWQNPAWRSCFVFQSDAPTSRLLENIYLMVHSNINNLDHWQFLRLELWPASATTMRPTGSIPLGTIQPVGYAAFNTPGQPVVFNVPASWPPISSNATYAICLTMTANNLFNFHWELAGAIKERGFFRHLASWFMNSQTLPMESQVLGTSLKSSGPYAISIVSKPFTKPLLGNAVAPGGANTSTPSLGLGLGAAFILQSDSLNSMFLWHASFLVSVSRAGLYTFALALYTADPATLTPKSNLATAPSVITTTYFLPSQVRSPRNVSFDIKDISWPSLGSGILYSLVLTATSDNPLNQVSLVFPASNISTRGTNPSFALDNTLSLKGFTRKSSSQWTSITVPTVTGKNIPGFYLTGSGPIRNFLDTTKGLTTWANTGTILGPLNGAAIGGPASFTFQANELFVIGFSQVTLLLSISIPGWYQLTASLWNGDYWSSFPSTPVKLSTTMQTVIQVPSFRVGAIIPVSFFPSLDVWPRLSSGVYSIVIGCNDTMGAVVWRSSLGNSTSSVGSNTLSFVTVGFSALRGSISGNTSSTITFLGSSSSGEWIRLKSGLAMTILGPQERPRLPVYLDVTGSSSTWDEKSAVVGARANYRMAAAIFESNPDGLSMIDTVIILVKASVPGSYTLTASLYQVDPLSLSPTSAVFGSIGVTYTFTVETVMMVDVYTITFSISAGDWPMLVSGNVPYAIVIESDDTKNSLFWQMASQQVVNPGSLKSVGAAVQEGPFAWSRILNGDSSFALSLSGPYPQVLIDTSGLTKELILADTKGLIYHGWWQHGYHQNYIYRYGTEGAYIFKTSASSFKIDRIVLTIQTWYTHPYYWSTPQTSRFKLFLYTCNQTTSIPLGIAAGYSALTPSDVSTPKTFNSLMTFSTSAWPALSARTTYALVFDSIEDHSTTWKFAATAARVASKASTTNISFSEIGYTMRFSTWPWLSIINTSVPQVTMVSFSNVRSYIAPSALPSPSNTPRPSTSSTRTPSNSPTPSRTPSNSRTPSSSRTPSISRSVTPTRSVTPSPSRATLSGPAKWRLLAEKRFNYLPISGGPGGQFSALFSLNPYGNASMIDNDGNDIYLGAFSGLSIINGSYVGMSFSGGDICISSGNPRTTNVLLTCGSSIQVQEGGIDSQGCNVDLVMSVPDICGASTLVGQELSSASPSPSRSPLPLNPGPSALLSLIGQSFSSLSFESNGINYNGVVKPFDSVSFTTSNVNGEDAPLTASFGSFSGWIIAGNSYSGHEFSGGDICPLTGEPRESKVYFFCGSVPSLISGDADTSGCAVVLSLTTPEICNVDMTVGAEFASKSPRPSASPLSGPSLLNSRLNGNCTGDLTFLSGNSSVTLNICPYRNATIVNTTTGHVIATLGTYSGWTVANGGYSAQSYISGDACLGGVSDMYSSSISYSCPASVSNMSYSVSSGWISPSGCTFVINVETQAACGVNINLGQESSGAISQVYPSATSSSTPSLSSSVTSTSTRTANYSAIPPSASPLSGPSLLNSRLNGNCTGDLTFLSGNSSVTLNICPYRNATIVNTTTGHVIATLGTYSGWTVANGGYSAQSYISGDACLGGVSDMYSSSISYSCPASVSNMSYSVSSGWISPSGCTFVINVETQAACGVNINLGQESSGAISQVYPSATSSSTPSLSSSVTSTSTRTANYSAIPPSASPLSGPSLLNSRLNGNCTGDLTFLSGNSSVTLNICPYRNATIVNTTTGHVIATLGTYSGWTVANGGYSAQSYISGDACLGGVSDKYSSSISYSCPASVSNMSYSVSSGWISPSGCTFVINVETQAACGVNINLGQESSGAISQVYPSATSSSTPSLSSSVTSTSTRTANYSAIPPSASPLSGPSLLNSRLNGNCTGDLTFLSGNSSVTLNICPYRNATIVNTTTGHVIATLGTYSGWTVANGGYSAQSYISGDACPGGVSDKYSSSISYSCPASVSNMSYSVSSGWISPSGCTFVINVETQAACGVNINLGQESSGVVFPTSTSTGTSSSTSTGTSTGTSTSTSTPIPSVSSTNTATATGTRTANYSAAPGLPSATSMPGPAAFAPLRSFVFPIFRVETPNGTSLFVEVTPYVDVRLVPAPVNSGFPTVSTSFLGTFSSWIVIDGEYMGQIFSGGDICSETGASRAAFIRFECGNSFAAVSETTDTHGCVISATLRTPQICGGAYSLGQENALPSVSPSPGWANISPSPSSLTGPIALESLRNATLSGQNSALQNVQVSLSIPGSSSSSSLSSLVLSVNPFIGVSLLNANGTFNASLGSFSGYMVNNGVYTGMSYTGGDLCPSTGLPRTAYLTYKCGSSTNTATGSSDATGCTVFATITVPEWCGVDTRIGQENALPSVSPSPGWAHISPSPSSLTGPIALESLRNATLSGQNSALQNVQVSLSIPGSSSSSSLSSLVLSVNPFIGVSLLNANGTFNASLGSFSGYMVNNGVYTGMSYTGGDLCPSTGLPRTAYLTYKCGSSTNTATGSSDATGCTVFATITVPEWCGVDTRIGQENALPSVSPSPGWANISPSPSSLTGPIALESLRNATLSGQNSALQNVQVSLSIPGSSSSSSLSSLVLSVNPFIGVSLLNANGTFNASLGSFSGYMVNNGVYTGMSYTGGDLCPSTGLPRTAYLTYKCGSSTNTATGSSDATGCTVFATITVPEWCGVDTRIGQENALPSVSPSPGWAHISPSPSPFTGPVAIQGFRGSAIVLSGIDLNTGSPISFSFRPYVSLTRTNSNGTNVTLGLYSGWLLSASEGSALYSGQLFSMGDPCEELSGTPRTAQVSLSCGTQNEILSYQTDPSGCMTSLIVSIPEWCAADTFFGSGLSNSGPIGLGSNHLSSLGPALVLFRSGNASVSTQTIAASQFNLTSISGFNSTRNTNVTTISSPVFIAGVPAGTVLTAVVQPFGSISLFDAVTGQLMLDGGTFAGWTTSNGVYTGMTFLGGDTCPITGKDRKSMITFKCGGSTNLLSISNITADASGCNLFAELLSLNACGVNFNVSTNGPTCSSSSSNTGSLPSGLVNPLQLVDSKSVANARSAGPQSLQGLASDAELWTISTGIASASSIGNSVTPPSQVPLPPSLSQYNSMQYNVAVMPNANGSSSISQAAMNGLPSGVMIVNADSTVALSLSLPPFGRAQLLKPDGSPFIGGNFGSFVSWIVSGPRYSGQVFAGGDVCPGSNRTRSAFVSYVCDSTTSYLVPSPTTMSSITSASIDASMCVLTATVGSPDFCGVDLSVGRESDLRSPTPSPLTGPSAFISAYLGSAATSLVGLLFQMPSTGAAYNLTVKPFERAFLTDPFSGAKSSLGTFQNWTFVGQNLSFSGVSGRSSSTILSINTPLEYSGQAFTNGDLCPGSTTRRRGIFVSFLCGGYTTETGKSQGEVISASTDSTGCGMIITVAFPEACGVNFTKGAENSLPSASPSPIGGPRNIVLDLRDDPPVIGIVVKTMNGTILRSIMVLDHFDTLTLVSPLNLSNTSSTTFVLTNQGQFTGWITAPDPSYVGAGTAPLIYIGHRYENGDSCSPFFVNLTRSAIVKLKCGSVINVTETIFNDAFGCSMNVTYTNPDLCGVNAVIGAEFASSSSTPSVTPSRTSSPSRTPSNTGTPSTTNTAPRSPSSSPSKTVSALPAGVSPSPSSSPHVVGGSVTFNTTVPGCASRSEIRTSGLEGALLDSISQAVGLDPTTMTLTGSQCQGGGSGSSVTATTNLAFSIAVDPPVTSSIQAGSAAGSTLGGVNLGGSASGSDAVLVNSILISQKLKSGLASNQGTALVKNALAGVSSKWNNITGANLTSTNVTITDVTVDVANVGVTKVCENGNGVISSSDASAAYTLRETIGAVIAALSSILLALMCCFYFLFRSKNDNKEVDESEEDNEQIGSDLEASQHSSSHHTSQKEAFAPTPFSGRSSSSSSALSGAFAEMARGNARGQADPATFTGANPMWSPPDPYERTSRTQGPKKGGRNKQPTQEEYLNHF